MATRMKPVDAVIVGFGWTGAIFAKELTDAGLNVVALERGGPRDTDPDFQPGRIHDELAFAVRHHLMQDLSRETITFRNAPNQIALPMRQLARSCWARVWAGPACTGTARPGASCPPTSACAAT